MDIDKELSDAVDEANESCEDATEACEGAEEACESAERACEEAQAVGDEIRELVRTNGAGGDDIQDFRRELAEWKAKQDLILAETMAVLREANFPELRQMLLTVTNQMENRIGDALTEPEVEEAPVAVIEPDLTLGPEKSSTSDRPSESEAKRRRTAFRL